ncbi:MAG: hypothetical protein A2297_10165 [Elusimicrobia bacterium RIFOXYB2_FULL_48_7]|nr:MAG: hypothetical protein A2297_10165 [Elusimicrobia bacterium RIFOXYB2_FULL_48_7]
MGIAIQLVITNLLVIGMGVFVFILVDNLKKARKAAAEPGGAQPTGGIDPEFIDRIMALETKLKNMPAKEDKVAYDQLMETKRNISDLYDRIEGLTGKNAAFEKTMKDIREEIKNAPGGKFSGSVKDPAGSVEAMTLVNEVLKKEINKAMQQQEEAFNGANEEVVGRISAIEQIYNKMADSIESSINDMKKQTDDKIRKMEAALKKADGTDYELVAKHVLKEQKDKLDEFKKELRDEFKGGQDEDALQKTMKKQDIVISGLKEYVKEALDKYDKAIGELEEKEKSDQKMIDFMDANLYEIKKKLDSLGKK